MRRTDVDRAVGSRVEQDVVSALNLSELETFHHKLLACSAALGSPFAVSATTR